MIASFSLSVQSRRCSTPVITSARCTFWITVDDTDAKHKLLQAAGSHDANRRHREAALAAVAIQKQALRFADLDCFATLEMTA